MLASAKSQADSIETHSLEFTDKIKTLTNRKLSLETELVRSREDISATKQDIQTNLIPSLKSLAGMVSDTRSKLVDFDDVTEAHRKLHLAVKNLRDLLAAVEEGRRSLELKNEEVKNKASSDVN